MHLKAALLTDGRSMFVHQRGTSLPFPRMRGRNVAGVPVIMIAGADRILTIGIFGLRMALQRGILRQRSDGLSHPPVPRDYLCHA